MAEIWLSFVYEKKSAISFMNEPLHNVVLEALSLTALQPFEIVIKHHARLFLLSKSDAPSVINVQTDSHLSKVKPFWRGA